MVNEDNINGYLKSIGHRLLGFSEELLRAETSLLSELRKSIRPNGLKPYSALYIMQGRNWIPVTIEFFTDFGLIVILFI